MRIIGIDPGLATTGWSIVDFDNNQPHVVDFGIISTEKGVPNPARLFEIQHDLNEIINKYKPQYSGVEMLLFQNNAKTAMAVGEARGVVLFTLESNNIEIYQFTPLQVKNSITGSGKADKKQVQENVKILCNLDKIPKPDDAADAIAIAVTCYDSLKMNNIISSNL
ncbi:MAG TPA: crossover junction endodeoxyribonuclease RuvC [Candidatus Dojkabacteria bacterium]|nr:crossover junction endodeoxyribonuclease RuvC [Candidatus Dojkabacteria bacterium]